LKGSIFFAIVPLFYTFRSYSDGGRVVPK
jgi:hypothetical protein